MPQLGTPLAPIFVPRNSSYSAREIMRHLHDLEFRLRQTHVYPEESWRVSAGFEQPAKNWADRAGRQPRCNSVEVGGKHNPVDSPGGCSRVSTIHYHLCQETLQCVPWIKYNLWDNGRLYVMVMWTPRTRADLPILRPAETHTTLLNVSCPWLKRCKKLRALRAIAVEVDAVWHRLLPTLQHNGIVPVVLQHPGYDSESWNLHVRRGPVLHALLELRAMCEDVARRRRLPVVRPVGGLHISWNN